MSQRTLYVDHFPKPASKIDIYVCSELFDRSAGLLASLGDLVDRPSTNKLAGGLNGMRRNTKAQQGRYSIFCSEISRYYCR